MRLKKFVAPTLKEATYQMRKELGENAIILNTRTVRQGSLLDFAGKEMFEIVAAIDDDPALQEKKSDRIVSSAATDDSFSSALFGANLINRYGGKETIRERAKTQSTSGNNNLQEDLKKIADQFSKGREARKDEERKTKGIIELAHYHEIKSELDDVKSALGEIAEHLKHSKMPSFPEHLRNMYSTLLENDVDEDIAKALVHTVSSQLSNAELQQEELVEKSLLSVLAQMIRCAEPLSKQKNRSRVVAFVGPTGVGKTTTIAKLSAICEIFNQYRVALVSADTYRIAAIDQLRTFATIANIPMEVAYVPEEMGEAIKKHSDKDVIFIDTVGRSQRQNEQIAELKDFLNAAAPDEIHLVLSATCSYKNLIDVAERFKLLNVNRLVFSKVDEAASLGVIMNMLHHTKLPVSYITTGQNVPDDIAIAEPKKLANLIYRSTAALSVAEPAIPMG